MYCPNCGNKNSAGQKFCRACGLALETIAQSLAEQLPSKLDESLQERKDRLEKLGLAALSVFGLGFLSFILYGVVYKLMMTQGKIMAGLALLALIVVLGCGLLSVILFAQANELKEASDKRRVIEPAELPPGEPTRELLPEAPPEPVFSVAERTTERLFAAKKRNTKGS